MYIQMEWRGAARRALAAAFLVGLSAAWPSTAVSQAEERLNGEFGLWVQEAEGELEVRWLTARPDSGLLRVAVDGRVQHEFRTPPAQAHRVRFARPRFRRLTLDYGALGSADDRHQTVVYPEPRPGRAVLGRADSIFVVADTHGEHDRLVRLLRNAGVLDEHQRWSGGRAHLVLLGDVMDRGGDVTALLWLLYRLEREAEQAGGRVHLLLGNHEVMVFTHDLRYVAPKELRIAELHGAAYPELFDIRRSVLGRWLASKPVLLKIGPLLFAHGGLTPGQLGSTVPAVNDSLRAFMAEELFYRWADTSFVVAIDSAALARRERFFWDEGSVLWHRGYVQADSLEADLRRVLRHFRAQALVVGHTPVAEVQERYGGALIAVHPPRPASQLLLLVRDGRAYRRLRLGLDGPPEPLSPPRGGSPPR